MLKNAFIFCLEKNSRAALNLGTDGYDDNFNNLSGLDDAEHLNGEKNDSILQYDVLVIPFSPESPDPIGVVPEHKVIILRSHFIYLFIF